MLSLQVCKSASLQVCTSAVCKAVSLQVCSLHVSHTAQVGVLVNILH